MAWIKRNIVFVIIMVVGVALAGVAGYFVYTAFSATGEARDKYTADLGDLTQLQGKKPFPSPDNIKIAKDDSQRVADIVKDLGTAFVNFPPPPQIDPREFITYLNTNLNHFRMEATNANVELIAPDYAFSFTAPAHQLSFTQTNFSAWMEQLEEIRAIVDILCKAKINSLDSLQRTPVPPEDATSTDFLPAAVTSNQVAIISPYKIAFRGFSQEVANVLKGFADSPHCFLIKDLEVTSSKSVPQGSTSFAGPTTMTIEVPINTGGGGGRGEGRRRGRREGGTPQMQTITVQAPTAPAGPVTILKPMPLFVTMVVDVVKLKNTQR